MLELLAAATGVELGKLILEQVLNLGKSALEDYVKDFFKDCIQSGVARANAETLQNRAVAFTAQLEFGPVQSVFLNSSDFAPMYPA